MLGGGGGGGGLLLLKPYAGILEGGGGRRVFNVFTYSLAVIGLHHPLPPLTVFVHASIPLKPVPRE